LIEVKQGAGAIGTYETKNKKGEKVISAGLQKHYEDFMSFKNNKNYAIEVSKDMLVVLRQKYELGLIKGLDNLFSSGNKEIVPELMGEPDFIILLANYHHYSTALQSESESMPDECRFYLSSFMGYGLYKDFVFSKKQMEQMFPKVFVKSQN
jgi:hypothetical protein